MTLVIVMGRRWANLNHQSIDKTLKIPQARVHAGFFLLIVQAGTPAAPGSAHLPLLPLGPDGVRRFPPRRTHPDSR